MQNTLWIDVTPLYWHARKQLDGICRVNYEYARELLSRDFRLAFFRCDAQQIVALSPDELKAMGLSAFCGGQLCAAGFRRRDDILSALKSDVKHAVKRGLALLPEEIESSATLALKAGWALCRFFFRMGKAGVGFMAKTVFPPKDGSDETGGGSGPQTPFNEGDVVLIIGLLWTIAPYAQFIREQAEKKYSVITVVHDLIPVLYPEAFSGAIGPQDFDLVVKASSCLCAPSRSAVEDIRRVASERGLPMPDVRRLTWGDTPAAMARGEKQQRPERFADLIPGKFVIYVSSITFRKNHEMVYQLWRHLYMEERDALLPLILVGGCSGELSEAFCRLMHCAPTYPQYLRHEAHVSDEALAWLYRNCRFTIYPSYYEGWGLPVRESLLHGKPCLCSDAGSIPEAGDGLVECLPPFAFYEWKDALLKYMNDDTLIALKSRSIQRKMKAVSWRESVDGFEALLRGGFPGLFPVDRVEKEL